MRVRSLCLWMAVLYTVLAGGAGYTQGTSVPEVPAATPAGMTELRRVVLPETPLRGYGTLGGEFVEYRLSNDQGVASLLRLAGLRRRGKGRNHTGLVSLLSSSIKPSALRGSWRTGAGAGRLTWRGKWASR